MKDFKLKASDVKSYARGRWDSIFASLAPKLADAIAKKGRHVSCPQHGGTNGFRLLKDSDEGHGICNTCKEFLVGGERKFQDGFGVLQWATGKDFYEVMEDVASIVAPHLLDKQRSPFHRPPPPVYKPPVRTQQDVENDVKLIELMREAIATACPMTDFHASELAWRYLESRGLPLPSKTDEEGFWSDIYFHHSLYYRDGDNDPSIGRDQSGYFPAILKLMRNRLGQVCAVHRTYLAPDGYGKAPVDNPKKMMGKPELVSARTIAVRLGKPRGGVIAAAEGFETALAVRAFTGFPCWSTYSSTILRLFTPPDGVVGVHFFGDLDRSGDGQDAARTRAEALKEMGYQTRWDVPKGPVPVGQKSLDWLDVYNQMGKDAIYEVESLRAALGNRKVVPIHSRLKVAS